ncbi:hypothetical protein [Streptomyces sp. NPDC002889]
MTSQTQVVVIGDQAGLAADHQLRRLGVDGVMVDAQSEPAGA